MSKNECGTIVQITPQWVGTKGGPSTFVSNLERELTGFGKEVVVLSPEDGKGVVRLRCGFAFRSLDIFKAMIRVQPIVVHIHGSLNYIFPAWIYKKTLKRDLSIVFTFHTMPSVRRYLDVAPLPSMEYSGFRSVLARFLIERCDAITSVSKSIIDSMNESYGLNITEFVVVHSAAHCSKPDASIVCSLAKQFGLRGAYPVLCTIGVMNWDWKVAGHRICIEAVGLLKDRFPNVRLLVVGDGQFRGYLEKMVDEQSLQEHVAFIGKVDAVENVLETADVYVHMALNEGCPHAIIEAMCAEKAIIAARRGGIPEIIENGKTGYLIEPTPSDLAEKIIILAKNAILRKELGENAFAFACRNFNWSNVAKKYIDIY
jgi:glycosyltransferase involved in cell wall biosynthesis